MMKIAEVRNQQSSQLQDALLLGETEEVVQILHKSKLNSMAYLMAITYGLDEQATDLAESEEEDKNWPVPDLTARYIHPPHLCNKLKIIGRFLPSADGTGWDVEDVDLEIPDITPTKGEGDTGEGYIHLPTQGSPPSTIWTKNSQLAIDHVVAGSFESACRLLHDQVSFFMLTAMVTLTIFFRSALSFHSNTNPSFYHYTAVRATISTWQQNIPSTYSYPQRNWNDAGVKNGLPVASIKLGDFSSTLTDLLPVDNRGKFAEAVEKLQSLLLQVTLLAVDTKQEISEVQQLCENLSRIHSRRVAIVIDEHNPFNICGARTNLYIEKGGGKMPSVRRSLFPHNIKELFVTFVALPKLNEAVEDISLLDLIQSDNKLLSRILISLGVLCEELSLLINEVYNNYVSFIFYGEEPTKGTANLLSISKLMEKLQRVCFFVSRAEHVIMLVLKQLCAILGKNLYNERTLDCLSRNCLYVLITLDNICGGLLKNIGRLIEAVSSPLPILNSSVRLS
ncbi:hypothetical protein FQR65_LT12449 [Abscondita terminalis]|nr:hypothetical protein FQR65_LT12449 [Abscondita terminalis]